eukprot:1413856-Rhodomonas_salina.2
MRNRAGLRGEIKEKGPHSAYSLSRGSALMPLIAAAADDDRPRASAGRSLVRTANYAAKSNAIGEIKCN